MINEKFSGQFPFTLTTLEIVEALEQLNEFADTEDPYGFLKNNPDFVISFGRKILTASWPLCDQSDATEHLDSATRVHQQMVDGEKVIINPSLELSTVSVVVLVEPHKNAYRIQSHLPFNENTLYQIPYIINRGVEGGERIEPNHPKFPVELQKLCVYAIEAIKGGIQADPLHYPPHLARHQAALQELGPQNMGNPPPRQ